jgi:CRP/FNR family transcriptional regulator, cyclic AMP receptor protein
MDTIDFLKTTELFNCLDEHEITAVSNHIKTKTVQKNTQVIIAGDSSNTLYIIKEGSVNVIARNEEGKEIVLSTLRTGDIFGELSLFDDKPRSAGIVSLENCALLALYKADFLELLNQSPKMALQVIKYLCQRIRFTNTITQNLVFMDVYERLKNFLYDMAIPGSDGKLVTTKPMSQIEIAAHIGSGREIISRILSELVEGGYISIEKKIITLHKKLPKGR